MKSQRRGRVSITLQRARVEGKRTFAIAPPTQGEQLSPGFLRGALQPGIRCGSATNSRRSAPVIFPPVLRWIRRSCAVVNEEEYIVGLEFVSGGIELCSIPSHPNPDVLAGIGLLP